MNLYQFKLLLSKNYHLFTLIKKIAIAMIFICFKVREDISYILVLGINLIFLILLVWIRPLKPAYKLFVKIVIEVIYILILILMIILSQCYLEFTKEG